MSPSRDFSDRYFAFLPNRQWKLVEMYPQESFGEVDLEVVESLWRRGIEWVRRDEVVDDRVGWKCNEHGWKYRIRLICFESEGFT